MSLIVFVASPSTSDREVASVHVWSEVSQAAEFAVSQRGPNNGYPETADCETLTSEAAIADALSAGKTVYFDDEFRDVSWTVQAIKVSDALPPPVLKGVTECGLPWRCVCMDRQHPDGKNFLILVQKGNEEIAVATDKLPNLVKSQWFDHPLNLRSSPAVYGQHIISK